LEKEERKKVLTSDAKTEKGIKPQENATHARKPKKKEKGTEKKGGAEEHSNA